MTKEEVWCNVFKICLEINISITFSHPQQSVVFVLKIDFKSCRWWKMGLQALNQSWGKKQQIAEGVQIWLLYYTSNQRLAVQNLVWTLAERRNALTPRRFNRSARPNWTGIHFLECPCKYQCLFWNWSVIRLSFKCTGENVCLVW